MSILDHEWRSMSADALKLQTLFSLSEILLPGFDLDLGPRHLSVCPLAELMTALLEDNCDASDASPEISLAKVVLVADHGAGIEGLVGVADELNQWSVQRLVYGGKISKQGRRPLPQQGETANSQDMSIATPPFGWDRISTGSTIPSPAVPAS